MLINSAGARLLNAQNTIADADGCEPDIDILNQPQPVLHATVQWYVTTGRVVIDNNHSCYPAECCRIVIINHNHRGCCYLVGSCPVDW